MENKNLTALQIACLTACVPCSGEPWLDKIISVSLRLKLATEFMNGVLSDQGVRFTEKDKLVHASLEYADALLAKFNSKPPSQDK